MGDLVAAAVIFPRTEVCGVRDSKSTSDKVRRELASRIRESDAMIGVGSVSPSEIDTYGMGWARRQVFTRALDSLPVLPDEIVVDGTIFEAYKGVKHACIPKADATVPCVSAASIIAKVERDSRVLALCDSRPVLDCVFGWRKNKGYPTQQHTRALKEHGVTDFHRKSFGPCKGLNEITLS